MEPRPAECDPGSGQGDRFRSRVGILPTPAIGAVAEVYDATPLCCAATLSATNKGASNGGGIARHERELPNIKNTSAILTPRALRERQVALRLRSGRWFQRVEPPLQLERAATTGRSRIRRGGP